jgi:hypothetical protein
MPKLVTLLFVLISYCAAAKGHSGGSHSHSHSHHHSTHSSTHKTHHSSSSHRHRTRSTTPRASFQRQNPCPVNGKKSGPCPGYIVDHVTPLKRGGADAPSNMQWQTKAAARAKDRME